MYSSDVGSIIWLSCILSQVDIGVKLRDYPAILIGFSPLKIKHFKCSEQVDKISVSEHRSILWIQTRHNWISGARLSDIVTIETSWTRVHTAQTFVLLEILWFAFRALCWCIYACNTILMARFALQVNIFIVANWTSFDNYTYLFSFNQLVRVNTLSARCISHTIAILATIITLYTLSHVSCFVKLSKVTLWANFKEYFSHLN
jgi:hypothetical protein